MPKKTGVEPELGDGHEESLESTEAQNNLHTTEQKVHQNRGCNTQVVSRRFDDTGQTDAKKENQPGKGPKYPRKSSGNGRQVQKFVSRSALCTSNGEGCV